MRVKKNKHIQDSDELEMTPMIDIVFQLLIFFLLSAKFIALEGQLSSYLPKDKGLSSAVSPMELVNVTFELSWDGSEKDGEVQCHTFDYRQPGTGARSQNYRFTNVDVKDGYQYQGRKVSFVTGAPVSWSGGAYIVPDFEKIEEYLQYRKETYEDPKGTGLPVTVNFDDKVPVQCVTVILDICQRLGIEDFTLAAKELE